MLRINVVIYGSYMQHCLIAKMYVRELQTREMKMSSLECCKLQINFLIKALDQWPKYVSLNHLAEHLQISWWLNFYPQPKIWLKQIFVINQEFLVQNTNKHKKWQEIQCAKFKQKCTVPTFATKYFGKKL